jgi:nucleotide-binding universal stress UspA family protein
MHTIVVGVDGSEHSDEAVRWAVREAHLRGVPLDLVTAWEAPALPTGELPVDEGVDFSGATHAELRRAAELVRACDATVRFSTHATHGHPTHVLVNRAAEAELLVLGALGHSKVVGLLLGSVSTHLAMHARCPVVMVRRAAYEESPLN